MPIYEYSCKKCGKTIEVIQKFSDPILKRHQGCGGTLTKLISASAFQLKGTGWYVTDYARKGQQDEGAGSGNAQESANTKGAGGKEKDGKPAPAETASKDSGDSGTLHRRFSVLSGLRESHVVLPARD
jgi:putative FmdB family regulatory protein